MDKINFLNDLTKRLCDALPSSLKVMKQDVETNVRSVLNQTFNKLDLVTREEFDAQTKVLARSRKRIESLEAKIEELEKKIAEQQKNPQ